MTMRTNQIRPSTMRRIGRRILLGAAAVAAVSLPQGLAAGGVINIPFAASNFSDPLGIDNQFYPLVVGTQTVFKATGADGCEEFRMEVMGTRVVAGVTSRVVHDEAYEDPECDGLNLILVERTDDWFAQDNLGNVWYMGEATEDCVGPANCSPGPGAWEAGVNGAKAGIIMLAHPTSGDQYYQELAPGIAEDQAKVTGITIHVSLKRADARQPSEIDGCLKTKEWTQLDTGKVEQKYYCPGVGLVAVDEHHGKRLRFELTDPAAADALRFRTVPKR